MPAAIWHIGLVGFSYPEWEGTLYSGVPKRIHRLAAYAAHFNAVEVNSTFYGCPSLEAVRAWNDATPVRFRFCVKMSRDVTHGPTPRGSLAAAEAPLDHLTSPATRALARRFIESLEPLGGKLGAVLLQFPPRFGADRLEELDSFLHFMGREVSLAIEFRHDSWWTPQTEAMLIRHQATWVAADESPRKIVEGNERATGPRTPMITSDLFYLRWLGKHGQFSNRRQEHFDPVPRLGWWAERVHEILEIHPRIQAVYGFFDNDFAGHAPTTATRFMNLIGVAAPGGTLPKDEPTLFG
jgi:uncharacterized protein YecE (DUF72 family)